MQGVGELAVGVGSTVRLLYLAVWLLPLWFVFPELIKLSGISIGESDHVLPRSRAKRIESPAIG